MNPEDFLTMCRMCGKPANQGASLLNNSEGIQWAIKYYKITLDSSIPMRICISCVDTIQKIRKFQQRYEKIQKKILELRDKAKSITIGSLPESAIIRLYDPYIPPNTCNSESIIIKPPSSALISQESNGILGTKTEYIDSNLTLKEPELETNQLLNTSVKVNSSADPLCSKPLTALSTQNIDIQIKDFNSYSNHVATETKCPLNSLEQDSKCKVEVIQTAESSGAECNSEYVPKNLNIVIKTDPSTSQFFKVLESQNLEDQTLKSDHTKVEQENLSIQPASTSHNLENLDRENNTLNYVVKDKTEQNVSKNKIVKKAVTVMSKWLEKKSIANKQNTEILNTSKRIKKTPEEIKKSQIKQFNLKEFSINLIRLSRKEIKNATKHKSNKTTSYENKFKTRAAKKTNRNIPECFNSSCNVTKDTEKENHNASDETEQFDSDATLPYDSDATICAELDDEETKQKRRRITAHQTNCSNRDSKSNLTNTDVSKLPIPWPKEDSVLTASYKCFICRKKYSSDEALTTHFTSQHSNTIFRCDQCIYLAKNKTILTRHIKYKHLNYGLKYNCKICDKNFSSKSNLKIHFNNVHTLNKINCKYCEKTYGSKSSLNVHIKNKHKIISNKISCNQCSKSFKDRISLKYHIIFSHVEIRLFSCKICDKTFKTQASLLNHKKTHVQNRDFVCLICDKKFKAKFKLRFHVDKVHK